MLIHFTVYGPGPAAGSPDSGHFKDLHKTCEFGYNLPTVCSAAAPPPRGGAPTTLGWAFPHHIEGDRAPLGVDRPCWPGWSLHLALVLAPPWPPRAPPSTAIKRSLRKAIPSARPRQQVFLKIIFFKMHGLRGYRYRAQGCVSSLQALRCPAA